ncbi:GNAT family N-acetyltransferase [Nocardia takedensis]|uniref:GNAT family N-acetyltransferase n=1 Tax=Nocardia takedensis TaxID=259390 RepID=UPI003F7589E7
MIPAADVVRVPTPETGLAAESFDGQPPGSSLEVLDRVVTVEEYQALRAAVGWQIPLRGQVEAALANSLAGVTARSAGAAVGMARLVGDGALYVVLVDVVVAPDHQHTGIGSQMVDRLTRWAHGRDIAHVSLTAAPEVVDFYRRAGFMSAGQSLRLDRPPRPSG